jgi:hypothetical protein
MSDERTASSCSLSNTYNLDPVTKRAHKGGWNPKAIRQRIQGSPANTQIIGYDLTSLDLHSGNCASLR